MRIRSYDSLDFVLAWKRVVNWAQGGSIDIPDRLPFEVLFRIHGDAGRLPARQHHLAPVTIVMSSKKTGTSRPLARLDPVDLTLYQALVDHLAADIEAALPGRDVVFAYRQNLEGATQAVAGSPTRASMESRVQRIFQPAASGDTEYPWRYAIKADIAGYFLQVRLDELEHQLYAITQKADTVRDLLALLRAWQTLGIRGLPQGIRPSAPLGNLYLRPIDALLAAERLPYVRWLDDWIIGAESFHRAREIQDQLERQLYEIGLTLSGEKTEIVRAAQAIEDSESAKSRLAKAKRARQAQLAALLGEMGLLDYELDEEDLPDPGELDLEATVEQFDEQLAHLEDDSLPPRFRSMLVEVFRDLGSMRHPHELEKIPRILERAPDLTKDATRYLVAVSEKEREQVIRIFEVLLDRNRFIREHEKLDLCQAVLSLPAGSAPSLAVPMGEWASTGETELIRARALLAWGAHSAPDDFTISDKFWASAAQPWRAYALVAIQTKDQSARDERYANWSGEGRFLREVAAKLQEGPLAWRKV